ncbi:hypothetical protein Ddye_020368 [Dipteronia dyeriana]|uniref:Uncharacterized protein n=1 Tax=Dipteronia dyeriana TaxID=168575 RepID=A0AAD9U0F2_9ROSI|nr:hypothetical protein Ddye_020368 [Dipteronia dyeriana]
MVRGQGSVAPTSTVSSTAVASTSIATAPILHTPPTSMPSLTEPGVTEVLPTLRAVEEELATAPGMVEDQSAPKGVVGDQTNLVLAKAETGAEPVEEQLETGATLISQTEIIPPEILAEVTQPP